MGYDIYASILNKDYDLSKFLIKDTEEEVTESIEEVHISIDTEEKKEKKRLNTFSVVCISINSLIFILMLTVFLWSRRLFFYIFYDIKTVSFSVLIISVLLYFPVMDIVRKS